MPLHPDTLIADLASRQHGRVARRQLLGRGLSDAWVKRRVRSGHLIPEFPGVYLVGHRNPSIDGRLISAALACGARARLTHLSTLMALRVIPYAPGAVHVAVPPGGPHERRGVIVHRLALDIGERTSVRGLPCTSVDRALMDSAPLLSRRQLERACDEAAFLNLLSPTRARQYLATRAGYRGAALLRSVLDEHDVGTTRTMSELEERFLALCDEAGFPRPVVNQWTQTGSDVPKLDFVWFAFGLVVETDGRAAHDIVTVQRRDARRDAVTGIAGFHVLRFTWWDVTRDGHRVIATLRPLLCPASRRLSDRGR